MVLKWREEITGCLCGVILLVEPAYPADKILRKIDAFNGRICGFKKEVVFNNIVSISPATPEAIKAVRWITDKIGLKNTFHIFKAHFKASPIAFASKVKGNRYIVYDEQIFEAKEGKLSWFDIGVFAHEIGHHIHSHTSSVSGSSWDHELAADRFAGFAVSKLNGTLENALVKTLNYSVVGSTTHPPRLMRQEAIKKGWVLAEKMKIQERGICKNSWLGGIMDVDGQSCRMAQNCVKERPKIRLACQDYDGEWIWQH